MWIVDLHDNIPVRWGDMVGGAIVELHTSIVEVVGVVLFANILCTSCLLRVRVYEYTVLPYEHLVLTKPHIRPYPY